MKNFIYEFRTRRVRRSRAGERFEQWNPVNTSEQTCRLVRTLIKGDAREQFIAIYLDNRNHLLGFEIIAIGCLNGVDLHPREIFRPAIVAPAAALVVAHNHPSGDPTPSIDDIAVTRRLHDAGILLGIPLLDHIVVTDNDHWSFAEHDEIVQVP